MPSARALLSGLNVSGSGATAATALPIDVVDFIGIGLTVTNVAGTTPECVFYVQWSFDGQNFTDYSGVADEDVIATMSGTGTRVKRIPVKAPYYRLAAQMTGSTPATFTVSANLLVW